MSLLSSPVSLLVSPANAYIDTLILPCSQYRKTACDRSFGSDGRMQPVSNSLWSEGYAFQPFSVRTTGIKFVYSRRNAVEGSKGSNIAAMWNPSTQETLINGVLQGRKQTDPKGASSLARPCLWDTFLEIDAELKRGEPVNYLKGDDGGFKKSDALKVRRQVKSDITEVALKDWN